MLFRSALFLDSPAQLTNNSRAKKQIQLIYPKPNYLFVRQRGVLTPFVKELKQMVRAHNDESVGIQRLCQLQQPRGLHAPGICLNRQEPWSGTIPIGGRSLDSRPKLFDTAGVIGFGNEADHGQVAENFRAGPALMRNQAQQRRAIARKRISDAIIHAQPNGDDSNPAAFQVGVGQLCEGIQNPTVSKNPAGHAPHRRDRRPGSHWWWPFGNNN